MGKSLETLCALVLLVFILCIRQFIDCGLPKQAGRLLLVVSRQSDSASPKADPQRKSQVKGSDC